jgi:hypothetical protein
MSTASSISSASRMQLLERRFASVAKRSSVAVARALRGGSGKMSEIKEWMREAAAEFHRQAAPDFKADMIEGLAQIIAEYVPLAPAPKLEDLFAKVKTLLEWLPVCSEGSSGHLRRIAVETAMAEFEWVDPHKLGFCCRYAANETCIGCGDETNGQPLPAPPTEEK